VVFVFNFNLNTVSSFTNEIFLLYFSFYILMESFHRGISREFQLKINKSYKKKKNDMALLFMKLLRKYACW